MVTPLERARRYISKCPNAISGEGGHDATFHVAATLVWGFALGEADSLRLLGEWNKNCVPPWSDTELEHKVRSVATAPHADSRGHLLGSANYRLTSPYTLPAIARAPAKPVEPVKAAENFLKSFRCGEADLFDASMIKPPENPKFDGLLLIEALYAPGEMVNFVTEYLEATEKNGEVKARPIGKGLTLERNVLVDRFRVSGSDSGKAGAWLRMNPLDGKGIADSNVTSFRFALLESDKLPLELQLSLFAKLPIPIVAILGSGSRSVHAWVKVNAPDVDEYRSTVARMLQLLAKFGVDGKNKNPSRLSRLPGARREIGAAEDGMQRLLYLNPNPKGGAIF
jgi:hypothetical protein